MKILAWNCRGLGGPPTVSQLRESLRFFKPELAFFCETKRRKGFVGIVCKRMRWRDRWYAVEPNGKSGGLLLGWDEGVTVHQVRNSSFYIELEFETSKTNGSMWAIFVYASNNEKVRVE